MEHLRSIIAFIHCFTGCDTTSGIAGKGKSKTVHTIMNSPNLIELAKPFYVPDSHPGVTAHNGYIIIAHIDQSKKEKSFDDLRLELSELLTAKSTFKLPPTIGAAMQHQFRAYYQLQLWFGNKLSVTTWGWKEAVVNNITMPTPWYSEIPIIPQELLKKLFAPAKVIAVPIGVGVGDMGCLALCTKCQDTGICTNSDVIEEVVSDSEEILYQFDQPSTSLDADHEHYSDISDYEGIDSDDETDCDTIICYIK